jgi:hypothetical protein
LDRKRLEKNKPINLTMNTEPHLTFDSDDYSEAAVVSAQTGQRTIYLVPSDKLNLAVELIQDEFPGCVAAPVETDDGLIGYLVVGHWNGPNFEVLVTDGRAE